MLKKMILQVFVALYRIRHPFSLGKVKFRNGGSALFPSIRIKTYNCLSISNDGFVYMGGVKMKGKNNSVEVEGLLYKSLLEMDGQGCSVIIGKNSNIKNTRIVIRGNNNVLKIGEDSTFGSGCWIVLMGDNNKIEIGKDCMIADNVDIWASDSHPIFSDLGCNNIINLSGSICLSDHVWLGKKSTVLKNVKIGKNSIIGIGSQVTRDIPGGSIAVGNPAKVVKEGINWSRKHINA